MENLTSKQKADELIDKYYNLFAVDLENTISTYEATQCAIMAVEDLIIEFEEIQLLEEEGFFMPIGYWYEVLTELKSRLN